MKKIVIICLVGIIILTLFYNSVDNSLTNEDLAYIPKYLIDVPSFTGGNYNDELRFIIDVQNAVLLIANKHKEIPYNEKREPKELYHAKHGYCFDRSRVIEKILRYSGFKTRHIALYSTQKTGSSFKSLLTPGVASHAVTEVLTRNGWLVVDSNDPWVSVDNDNQPISIESIRLFVVQNKSVPFKKIPNKIFVEPFTYVYGLYSRHGKYYPPYTFIPDINYQEFIQNFY